jgi:alpha-N-arabinofuranosidase
MEKYLINPNQKISKIRKEIYGNFSEHLGRCIYEGMYVGEKSKIPNINGMRCDVVNALKEMGLPVLRWPGGCFADEYHWMDGIGPKENRKKMINTHWGGVIEDNSFGTHEFFELCRQIGCEPYICGNVGSGTVQEMSDWIQYITFEGISPMSELRKKNGREEPWKLKYFGIGNENWGCGGNMNAEFYADQFNRYNVYVRNYYPDRQIYRIAGGPNRDDYHWTEVLMQKCRSMNGLSLHCYTGTGNTALEFNEEQYYNTLKDCMLIDEIITRHSEIMNRYDPKKRIGLIVDEWGTWHRVEVGTNPGFLYQQSSMRDAIVAGLSLNIFNKHSDRVHMANIAQTINVLQSVALTDGEKMILTPTYYVFKMFKDHQENTLLGSYITSEKIGQDGNVPSLLESASLNENGDIISTIVNTSASDSYEILCQIADTNAICDIKSEILTGSTHAHNSFTETDNVKTVEFTDFTKTADGFKAQLPPCSVVKFIIKR